MSANENRSADSILFPGLYVGGQWIPGDRTQPISNPATGAIRAHAPWGGPQALDTAVESALLAYTSSRHQPPYERAAVLHRIAQLVEADRPTMAALITEESGKPISLAEAEVTRAVATFHIASEEARRWSGETLPLDAHAAGKGHVGTARRFPIGLIYGITPFNFPLNLVAHKVAPAIATGNAILVKPAPKTPLTALRLAHWIQEAGVIPGQVNVVTCDNEWAGRLVGDPRVAMVSFTGSPDIGWHIKAQAGRQKVVLELGGNAGVIIHSDADWEKAVPLIVQGGFSNAGQSCISVQRVFVHSSLYDRVRQALVDWVRCRLRMGDPKDPQTVVGPMIDVAAARRVQGWVSEAVKGGARCLCGGVADGVWMAPTVLENVAPAMPVCAREVFGPVIVLDAYDDFDEALRRVNDSDYGLQAGVFTRDVQRIYSAYERLDVGGLLINNVPTFRTEHMPYGGVKASGFGREGVRYAMEEMTELKSLLIQI